MLTTIEKMFLSWMHLQFFKFTYIYRVQAGWGRWRRVSMVICVRKMAAKVIEKMSMMSRSGRVEDVEILIESDQDGQD